MSHEDSMLQEALELHNLQTNTSLLAHGLKMGLIEQKPNGLISMGILNLKLMDTNQAWESIILEFVIRVGVFISATGIVRNAINSRRSDIEKDIGNKSLYTVSIILHQILNFNGTSYRTVNRILMSVTIIIFSLTASDTPSCEDLNKYKQKIRHRLNIDYCLWCLLLAMNLVLTSGSPLYITLELECGIEPIIFHIFSTLLIYINFSDTMKTIGQGRLSPLIAGTPLLFLDVGDSMTLNRALFLALYYGQFWTSDWKDLVDWNHSMLCDAGVCNTLATEQGSLKQVLIKAKQKFDNWRLEEGLDDDGWFILLDSPPSRSTRNQDANTEHCDEEEEQRNQEGQRNQEDEYTGRVIYLQSRNPLLTSLAAVILIVLK